VQKLGPACQMNTIFSRGFAETALRKSVCLPSGTKSSQDSTISTLVLGHGNDKSADVHASGAFKKARAWRGPHDGHYLSSPCRTALHAIVEAQLDVPIGCFYEFPERCGIRLPPPVKFNVAHALA
jgi:hypothetical protein